MDKKTYYAVLALCILFIGLTGYAASFFLSQIPDLDPKLHNALLLSHAVFLALGAVFGSALMKVDIHQPQESNSPAKH